MRHTNALCLILIAASLLWLSSPLNAATFSVATPAQFQTALDTARNNGEGDTINVSAGFYDLDATLTYIPSAGEDNGSLWIFGPAHRSLTAELWTNNGIPLLVIDTTALDSVTPNIIIRNLSFSDGDAVGSFGGGLRLKAKNTNVFVQECLFYGCEANLGGGAYVEVDGEGSIIQVTRCRFTNNLADPQSGGGVALGSKTAADISFVNNILTGNSCATTDDWQGGGGALLALYSTDSGGNYGTINCINNTFIDNHCSGDGGGLYINTSDNASAEANLYNNIAYSNTCGSGRSGADIYIHDRLENPAPQSISFYNNDCHDFDIRDGGNLEQGYNIDQAPSLDDDFFLQSDSPCIDVGENTAIGSPGTDFSGGDRIVYGKVHGSSATPIIDMGADEYDPPISPDSHVISPLPLLLLSE
jgi:hypothetical protein